MAGSSAFVPALAGVLGGGRMGSGIAHALLLAGARVRLAEVDLTAAQAAADRVTATLEESAARDALPEPVAALLDRFAVGVGADWLAGCELAVEAVPENGALKARLLTAVESAVGPDGVVATNTSSLSIDELAAVLDRPEHFLGLHFFNPVPASRLVEVVVGSATSPALVTRMQELVTALGKTPVTVRDSPGFASSRLGLALGLEAIRMVEEGVAAPEDIDAAMTLGYRHPIGPIRLGDIVGLDVRLDIATYLAERLGPRFTPPQLLRDKVARGELGRKTGQGFYRW